MKNQTLFNFHCTLRRDLNSCEIECSPIRCIDRRTTVSAERIPGLMTHCNEHVSDHPLSTGMTYCHHNDVPFLANL